MSLQRLLEPEIMDSADEAQQYDEMDHAEVNRQFVDDLLAAGPIGRDVLDLGTGTALIPIELCERVDDCRVMAVDMSVAMLDLARYRVEVASLSERIFLSQVDAKQLSYDADMFDVVMSNSIVHHIPDPTVVLREAVRVTRGGGLIFFRDLVRPGSQAELDQLVETYAAQETQQARQLLADSLHASLSLEEVQAAVEQLGFSSATVSLTSDRHWTWCAQKEKDA